MKLYEIEKEILKIIDPETGEILDMEQLETLQIERSRVYDYVISLYKTEIAEAKAIKEEAATLLARAKTKENNSERLKKWLEKKLEGVPFENSRHKIGWRKSESIIILDENAIQENYKKIKTEINKKEIKKALKQGEVVQGATLDIKNNIQIK